MTKRPYPSAAELHCDSHGYYDGRKPCQSCAVDDLRAWARSRIDVCRQQESKFAPHTDAMIEAYTERRSLEAVLRIVDGDSLRTAGKP
jgi:hypothetical protein